jgi:hypothetical protein
MHNGRSNRLVPSPSVPARYSGGQYLINEFMKISNGKIFPKQDTALCGNGGTAPLNHDSGTRRGEWGTYSSCCFNPDKKPPVFAKEEAGWPAKQVWTLWRR